MYNDNQIAIKNESIKITNQSHSYLFEKENNIKCSEVYKGGGGSLEKSSSAVSNTETNQKYNIPLKP